MARVSSSLYLRMTLLVLFLASPCALGADPPLKRKDWSTLNAAEVAAVRNAILEMMKKDCKAGQEAPACEQADDGTKADADLSPLGWKYQASIHGSLPGAVKQNGWNTCQHSSWFFLPWHRMELYFFERILRKSSGNNTLTLPYWNFGVQPKLLPDFRMKMIDGKPNALWWKFRNSKLNTDDKPLCPNVVATDKAFSQTAFFTNIVSNGGMSFGGGAITSKLHLPGGPGSGQIEDTPHNRIHGAVGDDTKKSMSDPDGSGLDPIFWPIHANIDRAWACWQQKHPGSEPQSAVWLKNVKFRFFDVQDAAPGYKAVLMTGGEVINTAKQLGYEYDDPCAGFQLPAMAEGVESLAAPEELGAASLSDPLIATAEFHGTLTSEPITVPIHLPPAVQQRIRTLLREGARPGSIVLEIGGLAVDKPVGAAYQIYLNLPDWGVHYQSGHYVDNLSFFGIGHHGSDTAGAGDVGDTGTSLAHHAGETKSQVVAEPVMYDITDTVLQLVENGDWQGDQVSVTFANAAAAADDCADPPAAPADAQARFTQISLIVY